MHYKLNGHDFGVENYISEMTKSVSFRKYQNIHQKSDVGWNIPLFMSPKMGNRGIVHPFLLFKFKLENLWYQ